MSMLLKFGKDLKYNDERLSRLKKYVFRSFISKNLEIVA